MTYGLLQTINEHGKETWWEYSLDTIWPKRIHIVLIPGTKIAHDCIGDYVLMRMKWIHMEWLWHPQSSLLYICLCETVLKGLSGTFVRWICCSSHATALCIEKYEQWNLNNICIKHLQGVEVSEITRQSQWSVEGMGFTRYYIDLNSRSIVYNQRNEVVLLTCLRMSKLVKTGAQCALDSTQLGIVTKFYMPSVTIVQLMEAMWSATVWSTLPTAYWKRFTSIHGRNLCNDLLRRLVLVHGFSASCAGYLEHLRRLLLQGARYTKNISYKVEGICFIKDCREPLKWSILVYGKICDGT